MNVELASPVDFKSATDDPRRDVAVIILDDGAEASLLIRPSLPGFGVGSRFVHQGRDWTIRSARPHSKAYVAEPTRH